MKPIPQVVRERLQAGDAGPHPDPNLLAAFAENSLSKSARADVLQHLAACRQCREVLSVSVPEMPAAVVTTTPAGSAWLRWPVLRWGAVAACVIVVGAAVTLRYKHQEAARNSVSELPVSAPLVASQSKAPAAPAMDEFAQRSAKQESVRPGRDLAASKKAPSTGSESGRISPSVMASNAPAQIATEPVAPLSKDAAKLRVSPAPQEHAEVAANQVAAAEAKTADADELAEVTPGKAKEAAPTVAPGLAGGVAIGGPMKRQMVVSRALSDTSKFDYATNLTPRWTLSADGSLQRSLDSGKTWQNVAVPTRATLRTLAAAGPDIWVGGTGGALYHSSDSGQHWTEVKPSVGGKALTTDIIGVEFTDAVHGKVTTADREVWTTADAGKTWQKN